MKKQMCPTENRFGPYVILAPIGAGGMGAVYRARDTRLGREVALKILPLEASLDPDLKRRFAEEARSISALNHPNILTIYDVGYEHGYHFMVSEVVDGQSLRAILHRGPMPIRKLLETAIQVCQGLVAVHESGIIHRDLKPENIMVRLDGGAKILDFGLAKIMREIPKVVTPRFDTRPIPAGPPLSNETKPGMILGTVNYLSPEQALGETMDFRSDQFSLGLILFELATGKRAFCGAVRSKPWQPLSAMRLLPSLH